MATYYVRTDGNDANAGTGSAAGSAWLTIGKALGASGIASGDTLYIMSGTYREAVTVAMTSATVETLVKGDVDGSIFGGSGGEVIWSGFTTDDNTAPTGDPLDLAGRDYLTFRDIVFHGDDAASVGSCVTAATNTSTNITFDRCVFFAQGASRHVNITGANQVALNWTIKNCAFHGRGSAIFIAPSSTGSPDWDLNVQIINCEFRNTGATSISLAPTGAGTGDPGGVDVINCTFYGGTRAFTADANSSTTIPCTVTNCLITNMSTTGLNASSSGMVTSSYNRLVDNVSNLTNVTAGTGDVTAGIHGIDGGASFIQGINNRLLSMPNVSGILSGDGTASGAPATDIIGETRPNPPAVGAYEDTDVTPAASSGGGPLVGGRLVN